MKIVLGNFWQAGAGNCLMSYGKGMFGTASYFVEFLGLNANGQNNVDTRGTLRAH